MIEIFNEACKEVNKLIAKDLDFKALYCFYKLGLLSQECWDKIQDNYYKESF